MFRQITSAAVAAAALLAAVPTLASAQTVAFGNSPVALTSCSVTTAYDPSEFRGPLQLMLTRVQESSDVALGYINKASVPATAVTFVVNDGSHTQRIVARGTFAPNVQIDRTVEADARIDWHDDAHCRVAEVQFADGSAWHADRRDLVNR
jgi:hypothetical protein